MNEHDHECVITEAPDGFTLHLVDKELKFVK